MASFIERATAKLRREWAHRTAVLRSPLRAGIIGYGGIASEHLDGYRDTGMAQVVGVCDLHPTNLARALDRCPTARAYLDLERMLDAVQPDVVSICTWPQHHAEAVEAAAAAGVRGILCEKPLALQLADLVRMRTACRRQAVKLAGGHQYRFHRRYMKVAEIIRSGELGRVTRIMGNIKSTLANNGPHLFDTVRFILGDPTALRVTCRCRRERGEFNRGIPAEDAACGEILFSNDLALNFSTGDLSPDFFSIKVDGTGGSLEVTLQALMVKGELRILRGATMPDCRQRQFREFINWVKGRRVDYAAEFDPGAQTVELVLALYESARLDRPVELPMTNNGDVIRKLYPTPQVESLDQTPAPAAAPMPHVHPGAGGRLAMDGGPRAVPKWFSTQASFGTAELANLASVILSGNLSCTGGRMVPALEQEFARFYGSPHAVASTSGTAAVHVALAALGLNPGDEVITTPMTDMGTVIPILASNCIPIFADIDPVTGILTAESIARRINSKTRAVILVHLFGQPADLSEITDLLREKRIPLIEDCAQAHGAEYRGRKVGTFGDFGCFSLQQSKQITCGDGGVTLVNRADLAQRAALFVDKGWDRKQGARAHKFLGMNYRMTELQGAVALAQLGKLAHLVRSRREGAGRLSRQLRELPGIIPPAQTAGVNPSWWMYAFRIDEDRLRIGSDAFADALLVEGVQVSRQYLPEPIFHYEVLKCQRTYGDSRYPFSAYPYQEPALADFPGLREFNRRLLLLPWSHNVRAKHTDALAMAVRKVVKLLLECPSQERDLAPETEASPV
jgi:dTDP-4-amino-4,6-dideoxygalactose transaminase/predicted dehydrogenase